MGLPVHTLGYQLVLLAHQDGLVGSQHVFELINRHGLVLGVQRGVLVYVELDSCCLGSKMELIHIKSI